MSARHILLLIVPACLLLEVGLFINMLPRYLGGSSDFRGLYVAGYMVRTGQSRQLYDLPTQERLQRELVSDSTHGMIFVRPPYAALIFAPISWLSYRAAYLAWIAINLGLLLLALWLLRASFKQTLVALTFVPVALAILDGQDSILLFLLVCGSLALLRREEDFLAGLVLALGLFKFNLVLPMAACFLIWKRRKFAAGLTCGLAAVSGLCFLMIGVSGMRAFLDSLISNATSQTRVYYQTQASFHALSFGLFGRSALAFLAMAGASLATVLMIAKSRPEKESALVAAIPAAFLLTYYANVNDWVLLLAPIFSSLRRERFEQWAAVLMFSAPALAVVSWEHAYLVTVPIAVLGMMSTRIPAISFVAQIPRAAHTAY